MYLKRDFAGGVGWGRDAGRRRCCTFGQRVASAETETESKRSCMMDLSGDSSFMMCVRRWTVVPNISPHGRANDEGRGVGCKLHGLSQVFARVDYCSEYVHL